MESRNPIATQQLIAIINDTEPNLEKAMALVRLGANPNVINQRGATLLHILTRKSMKIADQYCAWVKELVELHDAHIHIKNAKGFTPFQSLLNKRKFFLQDALELIRLGADVNSKNKCGKALLHKLLSYKNNSIHGEYDTIIEQLIMKNHAYIDIKDANGFTPLQNLINAPFLLFSAMNLIRLGANPLVKNERDKSIVDILSVKNFNLNGRYDASIDKIVIASTQYARQHYYPARSHFLNLLILLVYDMSNDSSVSFFKILPLEIVSYIVSFLAGDDMGKTQKECFALANQFFCDRPNIKAMMRTPGGINVFQKNHTETNARFVFFKSAVTFCHDVENFKSNLKNNENYLFYFISKITKKELSDLSQEKLQAFSQKYAIRYWQEHSSLFKRPISKKILFDTIKNSEPYNQPAFMLKY